MRALAFALIACLGAAWAQTTPPAAESQQDRLRRLAAEAAAADRPAASATVMPSDLPGDAVIAKFDDGTPLTMADFKRIVTSLPEQNRQMALANPKKAVEWWAGMRKLAQEGEAAKLNESSPTREQLEVSRTMILGQAMMNSKLNTMDVENAEIDKYYEDNKEQFKQVRVKALYIAFGDSAAAGKQSRTEAQALDEAKQLLAQIRAGADFVKLVKERSDDQTSREKDGDFATFRKKDNIPDAIAAAVFALKQGSVSEPVRQPNGYYLLRAEEISYFTLTQVRADILLTIRDERFNRWLQQNTAGVKVEFPNPAFGGPPAAAPPAPAPPAK